MTTNGHCDEHGADAEIPSGLRRDMTRLYGGDSRQMDPAAAEEIRLRLDAEWARMAGQPGQAAGRGGRRFPVWARAAAAGGVAAAAAIGIFVAVGLPGSGGWGDVRPPVARGPALDSGRGSGAGPALARGDVDGSGGVDIVDAFVLARAIAAEERRTGKLSALWDVTGNGVVDGGDVDAVAMRAVRLEGVGGAAGGAG